jgi:peptide/nickel transport system permease protein
MLSYAARRIAIAIPVFIGVTVVAFAFVRALPGDPVKMQLDPSELTGPSAQQYIAHERAAFGLDKPVPIQYLRWLENVLHGNLGFSYQQKLPVTQLFDQRIGPSLLLIVTAVVVALILGLIFGVLAALRHNTWVDYLIGTGGMLAVSVPGFFLGLLAVYVLGLKLSVLPVGEMHTLGEPETLLDTVRHLILPAGVLGATLAGPYMRYVRQGMLEVLDQRFITAATAKGVSWRGVVVRHALRNALVPLTTALAVQLPALLAGTVLIEKVFAWPGMGTLILDSVTARDYPVLLGTVLITAICVMCCNLLADLGAAVLDPRIRLS